jgi:hypothetical protein
MPWEVGLDAAGFAPSWWRPRSRPSRILPGWLRPVPSLRKARRHTPGRSACLSASGVAPPGKLRPWPGSERCRKEVESTAGAVAVGRGSSCCRRLSPDAGASVSAWLRFPPPPIEPDLRICRIRLSDRLHERACAGLRFRRSRWRSITPSLPYTSAKPKRPVPRGSL